MLLLLLKMLFTSESLSLFRGIVSKFLIFSWTIVGNISVYFKCIVSYRCSRELSLIYFTKKTLPQNLHTKTIKKNEKEREKTFYPLCETDLFRPKGSLLLLK